MSVDLISFLLNFRQVGILRLVQAHEGPPFRKDDAFITTPERAFQEWLQVSFLKSSHCKHDDTVVCLCRHLCKYVIFKLI